MRREFGRDANASSAGALLIVDVLARMCNIKLTTGGPFIHYKMKPLTAGSIRVSVSLKP